MVTADDNLHDKCIADPAEQTRNATSEKNWTTSRWRNVGSCKQAGRSYDFQKELHLGPLHIGKMDPTIVGCTKIPGPYAAISKTAYSTSVHKTFSRFALIQALTARSSVSWSCLFEHDFNWAIYIKLTDYSTIFQSSKKLKNFRQTRHGRLQVSRVA